MTDMDINEFVAEAKRRGWQIDIESKRATWEVPTIEALLMDVLDSERRRFGPFEHSGTVTMPWEDAATLLAHIAAVEAQRERERERLAMLEEMYAAYRQCDVLDGKVRQLRARLTGARTPSGFERTRDAWNKRCEQLRAAEARFDAAYAALDAPQDADGEGTA